jgi:hypothetical protein
LNWLKILFCNFFSFKILWIAMVLFHIVFLFYFFKIIFVNLFLNWADWEFSFVIFFLKTLLIATVFLRMFFFVFVFLWFSPKLSFFILFFNIELVKNYSYNMWGKHCNFPRKLLWIATVFFPTWFFLFCYIFSLKLSLSILFFKYYVG